MADTPALSAWAQLATTQGIRIDSYNDETAALACSVCGDVIVADEPGAWPVTIVTFVDLLMLVAGHLTQHIPASPAPEIPF
jgi:hypothetical protein